MFTFLVAARFADPIVSLPPYQFARDTLVSEKEQLLKSPEQIRQLFTAAGVTGNTKAVSYCEIGLQASYFYMLARYLGFDAAMYDGSYSEWSDAKQPVVRGDSPE